MYFSAYEIKYLLHHMVFTINTCDLEFIVISDTMNALLSIYLYSSTSILANYKIISAPLKDCMLF